jgi:hypothetical protein
MFTALMRETDSAYPKVSTLLSPSISFLLQSLACNNNGTSFGQFDIMACLGYIYYQLCQIAIY